MAWTAPRTWVANEVVTATLMNTHIKDNLVALSTHAHGGAAGAGNDELSGVDQVNFDDLSASPSTAGRLQRNGNNLEWYGAAKIAFTEADAAAGTASPRTLGTSSTQAAAGNHGHTVTDVAEASTYFSGSADATSTNSVTYDQIGTGEVTLIDDYDPGSAAAGRTLILYAFVNGRNAGGNPTIRIYEDNVQIISTAITFNSAANFTPEMAEVRILRTYTSAHDYDLRIVASGANFEVVRTATVRSGAQFHATIVGSSE